MPNRICLLLIAGLVLLGSSGCSSTSRIDQAKPDPSTEASESLTKRFPARISGFTLQSATGDDEKNEAQALYKPKNNEHVYSIVIIREFPSKQLAVKKIKDDLGQQGEIMTLDINDSPAWSAFVKKPDVTCYLGIAKDRYAIEIDTHFTMGYEGEKNELLILSRNLSHAILAKWQ